ncbi:mucin-12-like [Paramacrobiotus metropolitanus]|uniref:mucin-12-like n=1 Tax=Paramacrobiotus metropolitanus TaxID=2943436 RepID=UPI002445ECFA|nr:mucin-12-like [Paramacrobiotus metropolitanus]XP_055340645.1 mucin-12-like [Paramacrobiotus metropolitanus]XP_055340647.1 mucin-12-like [Paramacrobiotus metropolitanus]
MQLLSVFCFCAAYSFVDISCKSVSFWPQNNVIKQTRSSCDYREQCYNWGSLPFGGDQLSCDLDSVEQTNVNTAILDNYACPGWFRSYQLYPYQFKIFPNEKSAEIESRIYSQFAQSRCYIKAGSTSFHPNRKSATMRSAAFRPNGCVKLQTTFWYRLSATPIFTGDPDEDYFLELVVHHSADDADGFIPTWQIWGSAIDYTTFPGPNIWTRIQAEYAADDQFTINFYAHHGDTCNTTFIDLDGIDTKIAVPSAHCTTSISETTPELEETTPGPEETEPQPEETTPAPEGTTIVSEETTSAPEETTTEPEETTPAPEETTNVPAETTSAPEETTTAPEETTPAPEETTNVPAETTSAPEETTTAPEETTPAPEETTNVPAETTSAPEETTTAPEETTPAPEETTIVQKETTSPPEENTTEPEETTPAPDTTIVPEETTAAPGETSTTPASEEATTISEETSLVPQETTLELEETTSVPEETTTLAEENTLKTDSTTPTPVVETTPELVETAPALEETTLDPDEITDTTSEETTSNSTAFSYDYSTPTDSTTAACPIQNSPCGHEWVSLSSATDNKLNCGFGKSPQAATVPNIRWCINWQRTIPWLNFVYDIVPSPTNGKDFLAVSRCSRRSSSPMREAAAIIHTPPVQVKECVIYNISFNYMLAAPPDFDNNYFFDVRIGRPGKAGSHQTAQLYGANVKIIRPISVI